MGSQGLRTLWIFPFPSRLATMKLFSFAFLLMSSKLSVGRGYLQQLHKSPRTTFSHILGSFKPMLFLLFVCEWAGAWVLAASALPSRSISGRMMNSPGREKHPLRPSHGGKVMDRTFFCRNYFLKNGTDHFYRYVFRVQNRNLRKKCCEIKKKSK